jgi:hypothetical protein
MLHAPATEGRVDVASRRNEPATSAQQEYLSVQADQAMFHDTGASTGPRLAMQSSESAAGRSHALANQAMLRLGAHRTPLPPSRFGMLQRKFACGGGCPRCSGAAPTQPKQTKRDQSGTATATAPPIVHNELRSPGQPLDLQTRAFMEPRFGYDFGQVRVHDDTRAAESAQRVDALAYTVGRDVVFGAGQFAPTSIAGRELLAHELAHVVQQAPVAADVAPLRIGEPDDPQERAADRMAQSALAGAPPAAERVPASAAPMLARRVIPRLVHCTPGGAGAPALVVDALTDIVENAQLMATAASFLLNLAAAQVRAGIGDPTALVNQDFDDHFASPPEAPGGFLNRLTGAVRPTRDIALSEEMTIVAGRFARIAATLGDDFNNFLCIDGPAAWGTCTIAGCTRDAFACPNVDAYFLCPGFWSDDPRTSATLLIHETAHMIWERVFHGAEGSGGNFRHAECYASFVSDIFHLPPGGPECVPPP